MSDKIKTEDIHIIETPDSEAGARTFKYVVGPLSLKKECEVLAAEIVNSYCGQTHGIPQIADTLERTVMKYVHKTVSKMLGPNASDGAHFNAMNIVDMIKDGK